MRVRRVFIDETWLKHHIAAQIQKVKKVPPAMSSSASQIRLLGIHLLEGAKNPTGGQERKLVDTRAHRQTIQPIECKNSKYLYQERDSRNPTCQLLVACPNHLEPSLSGGDQPVRAGRPFERLRLLPVVKLDELLDRRLEILEGIVDAAPETAVGQLPEEALDRVHPGAGGRREAEGPAPVVRQPVRDGRVLE